MLQHKGLQILHVARNAVFQRFYRLSPHWGLELLVNSRDSLLCESVLYVFSITGEWASFFQLGKYPGACLTGVRRQLRKCIQQELRCVPGIRIARPPALWVTCAPKQFTSKPNDETELLG